MFIKDVIIDGFKSYSQMTKIEGLDRQFNAIVGKNGTGKSNIFDSICFVLGITNLKQVRAGNLQELVYKSGNAGISRAYVILIFDNTDKPASPIGYEDFDEISVKRQITIGGKDKYFVNDRVVERARVHDLFQSVSLNVNNPHFIIAQGQINKVSKMSPKEVVSLLEEAAGTRMYNDKKERAERTIQRKEAKLQEISSILTEEIEPHFKKLHEQQKDFMEYERKKMDVDNIRNIVVANQYHRAEALVSGGEIAALSERQAELKQSVSQTTTAITNNQQNINILKTKRDQDSGLQALTKNVGDLSQKVVKANNEWEHAKKAVSEQESAKTELEGNIEDIEAQIKKKQTTELEAKQMKNEKLAQAVADSQTKLEEAEKREQAAFGSGMSDEDGTTATFADQLTEAKTKATTCQTNAKQATMRLKHAEKELKTKRPQAKKYEKEYKTLQSKMSTMESDLEKCKVELDNVMFDADEETSLQAEAQQLEGKIAKRAAYVDKEAATLSKLDFSYSDPCANFDRSKVNGTIAQLITIKDAKYETAIEVAAGGKLYNVVVDTEQTGKQLLQKGNLKRRVTIIPLNKIRKPNTKAGVVGKAQEDAGQGNADLALSLVGYDEQLGDAMSYVFGSTMICKDADAANKICFGAAKMKCITLDGDVYDPSGVMTGGSRSKTNVLGRLRKLNECRNELQQLEFRYREVKSALEELGKVSKQFAKLTAKYELKSHEFSIAKTQLEQTTVSQMMEELAALEATLLECKKIVETSAKEEKDAKALCKKIEVQMKEFESQKESRIKKAAKDVKDAKSALTKAKEKHSKAKDDLDEMQTEVDSLKGEILSIRDQISTVEGLIVERSEAEQKAFEVLDQAREACEKAQAALDEKQQKLKVTDEKIKSLTAEIQALKKQHSLADDELREVTREFEKKQKDGKDAKRVLDKLLSENPWIESEKQLFGVEGTPFEFRKGDPKSDPELCQKALNKITAELEQLERRGINQKIMSSYSQIKKKYEELQQKIKQVENDRTQIEKVIGELDEKKQAAVQAAFEKVNKDFNRIFSTLLPGSSCKLIASEKECILNGLTIKVRFGERWLNSLVELSGGQRSLLALSLVLSLLLFKPAPLYILDEVDAALDENNTQNVGTMIKKNFPQSQFLIVSHKMGMFNNANCTVKTRFEKGSSFVDIIRPGAVLKTRN